MREQEIDLAVVGAGPAGLAAAVQARRLGLDLLVLEEDRPGGALATAFFVENYPGFPGGVAGRELARRMVRQAQGLGVPIRKARVLRIRPEEGAFLLETDRGPLQARAVIAATGSRPRALGLPGEEALRGEYLFHRADRLLARMIHEDSSREDPGRRHRPADPGSQQDLHGSFGLERSPEGKVLVLGGGDAAFDQAAYLASRDVEVLLACRSARPRALERIVALAEAQGVRVLLETRLRSLEIEEEGLVAFLSSPAGEMRVKARRLLLALGKEPDFSLLPREALTPGGILPPHPMGRTGLPGLFAAGDLRRGRDRQAVIAAGDGMAAALEAARYLQETRNDR